MQTETAILAPAAVLAGWTMIVFLWLTGAPDTGVQRRRGETGRDAARHPRGRWRSANARQSQLDLPQLHASYGTADGVLSGRDHARGYG